jgi:hypothetical protein
MGIGDPVSREDAVAVMPQIPLQRRTCYCEPSISRRAVLVSFRGADIDCFLVMDGWYSSCACRIRYEEYSPRRYSVKGSEVVGEVAWMSLFKGSAMGKESREMSLESRLQLEGWHRWWFSRFAMGERGRGVIPQSKR